MKTIDYIKTWLEEKLTSKRFHHSLGCAETAQKLAKLFNLDEEKAYLAGLIHDCAKNFDDAHLLYLIKNEIKTGFDSSELKNPKTYPLCQSNHYDLLLSLKTPRFQII